MSSAVRSEEDKRSCASTMAQPSSAVVISDTEANRQGRPLNVTVQMTIQRGGRPTLVTWLASLLRNRR
jgi:hypothetical protein